MASSRHLFSPGTAESEGFRLHCTVNGCAANAVPSHVFCSEHYAAFKAKRNGSGAAQQRPSPPKNARLGPEQLAGTTMGLKIMRRKTAPRPSSVLGSSHGHPKQNPTPSAWQAPAPNTPKQASHRRSIYSPAGSSDGSNSPPRKRPRTSVDGQSRAPQNGMQDNGSLRARHGPGSPDHPRDYTQGSRDSRSSSLSKDPRRREELYVDGVVSSRGYPNGTKSSCWSTGPRQPGKDTTFWGGLERGEAKTNGRSARAASGPRATTDSSLNKALAHWWEPRPTKPGDSPYQGHPDENTRVRESPDLVVGRPYRPNEHLGSRGSRGTNGEQAPSAKPTPAAATLGRKEGTSPRRERPEARPTAPKPPVEVRRERLAARLDTSRLDALVYGQEGASEPPPGAGVVPRRPGARDAPFFAHIDPRKLWKREHSARWYEERRKETEARGGRKANFGKAAERMRRARPEPEPAPAPAGEALPPRVLRNEGWVRALHWVAECDKKDLERYKEAKRGGREPSAR